MMAKEKIKKEDTLEERRSTTTAFLLLFPTLILAAIGVFFAPAGVAALSVLIAVYQFIMTKRFIEDYYGRGR